MSAAPEISDFRSTWLSALWDWCFKTNRQDINSSSASLSSKTAFREEQFLDACMMGDIVLVKHFLQLDRPQSSEEEAVINDDEKPVNASVVTPQTKNVSKNDG